MLYPCNAETERMSQAELQAYYEGAESAMIGGDNIPGRVYENPSSEISSAYRKGYAAQIRAMQDDSSII